MKKKFLDKSDWIVEKETFGEHFAKILSKDPKKLKAFKKHIAVEFNKNRDTALFLRNLKTLIIAEGKAAELAKSAKVNRTTVYKMLADNANPSFKTIVSFVFDLGIKLNAVA
ncbi:MAG: hypothetical protein FWC57_05685 [Endomicrobia bacterium]|nr:hypothetical protein [Endomicrobiia bacterium]